MPHSGSAGLNAKGWVFINNELIALGYEIQGMDGNINGDWLGITLMARMKTPDEIGKYKAETNG